MKYNKKRYTIMKKLLFSIIILLKCVLANVFTNMLVTKNYTEYLKNIVEWEVQDYDKNIFKGWTHTDFIKTLGDFIITSADTHDTKNAKPEIPANLESQIISKKYPKELDWSNNSCITGIRNQGECGACWAFVVAGVVSDRCCLKGGKYGWLSPQQLISCIQENYGCIGGDRTLGFDFVKQNGLVPETCYKYSENYTSCQNSCENGQDWKNSHVCKCKKIQTCEAESGLIDCLQSGPVAGGMAVYNDLIYYKNGIYKKSKDAKLEGYHSIKIVGYGENYWKCANTWGKEWGMNGYFLIAKGECEIETRNPMFCEPNP